LQLIFFVIVGWRLRVEDQADGLEGVDGVASGGFDDGTNVGVETCRPFGAEAIVTLRRRAAPALSGKSVRSSSSGVNARGYRAKAKKSVALIRPNFTRHETASY